MARTGDIIEIVEYEYYHPRYDVGTHYVVLDMIEPGGYDEWDVPIINTKGEYTLVCQEEYQVVGNVKDKEQAWLDSRPTLDNPKWTEESDKDFFDTFFQRDGKEE